MFQGTVSTELPKRDFYDELAAQAHALLAGETNLVANAANLSALLYHTMPDLNWAGFYFLVDGELVVGPFQGKPACVRIAMGRGVCGLAAQTRRSQLVPDVHAFADHIACDAASRSELVVPLLMPDGTLLGVLDLDSPLPARFTEEDCDGVEAIASVFIATLASSDTVS
ncbi:GAF domain-containing protein [Paraburkholderia sp. BL10I2N1]|uniref:GAF domain-containing protein n=1 Tax=Paraburkholderia sp. BL10I2N1 TaxID=1938796 RepID=UPI00105F7A0C|nr:GAF domain-containing protein [Paraburkholderia sp. BL10I2N1]TDN69418.1 GAF domain-containing protein [Paraburkholderia sp. BL10I2N1]